MITFKLLNLFHKLRFGYPRYYTIKELEAMANKLNSTSNEFSKIAKSPLLVKDIIPREDTSIFSDIIGHDNIKKILENMTFSVLRDNRPVSILLDGSAGCAKSMFLKDIQKFYPHNTYYVDGSKATKAGIFNLLFEDENNNIRFLIIDEIDKLNIDDQESLLTLIEDGRVIQTQKNGTFNKKYDNLSVIAASNDKENMLYPLLTRFFKIKIKDYTVDEFKEISKQILKNQFELNPLVCEYIILRILETKKKPNIRDVKQLAKLCNNDKNMVDLLIESSG